MSNPKASKQPKPPDLPAESPEGEIFRLNMEHEGPGGYFMVHPERGLWFCPYHQKWHRRRLGLCATPQA
jgi:hypothetical protein